MEDLVCISHLRWDFVWQRPQHLLSRFAQYYRVLFVEEPISSTEISKPQIEVLDRQTPQGRHVTVIRLLQPMEENRWIGHGDELTQQTYSKLLNTFLKTEGYTDPVLWLYTPMALPFVHTLRHRALIFDVMDELSAFKGAPPALIEQERKLLKGADVVFTGGVSLYRSKLPHNPNTHLFPSGVEIPHFARAARRDHFECPADLVDMDSPVLGYFGVIDERMDLGLIAHLAQARPDWNLAMIGPVVKISEADLPHAPNIHYLGMRSYEQLPAYLAHFDVALIPFALNESTRFLSPTKTLEYMAAHKPIVSTPIRDVIELYGDVVRVGYSPEGFAGHVQRALTEDAKARYARENALLAQHSWDSIAQRMHQVIAKRLHTLTVGSEKRTVTQPGVPLA
jgi:UDP-galactopyranose mutase